MIKNRVNMRSRATKTNSEFEIGDRVIIGGKTTGTVVKTFRNGDVQVKTDAGTEAIYLAHTVKELD